MIATARIHQPAKPSLSSLMASYGEIYRQLGILLDLDALEADTWVSERQGHPPVYCLVLERHRYTTLLRLTHLFAGEHEKALNPDAHVRIYHDAHVGEVTHCCHDALPRKWNNSERSTDQPFYDRLQQNYWFDQWLEHLLAVGHSWQTFVPCEDRTVRQWLRDAEAHVNRKALPAPKTHSRD